MPCVRGLQVEWHSVVKGKPSRCLAESAMSNVENAQSHTVRMRDVVTLSPPSACVSADGAEGGGWSHDLVFHDPFAFLFPTCLFPSFCPILKTRLLLHHIISRRHIRPRLSQPECPLRLAKTTSPVCALERRTVVITESALDSKPSTRLPSSATSKHISPPPFSSTLRLYKRERDPFKVVPVQL